MSAIVGTNGSETIIFGGNPTLVKEQVINPYSSETILISGEFQVSENTYDGLGGFDTMIMTSSSDFLTFTDQSGTQVLRNIERFIALDGDDFINLSSFFVAYPDAEVFAGSGNDIVWANSGNDLIFGEFGNDIIDGGPGNDDLRGNGDNDQLYGGDGNDLLNGGADKDFLAGGQGDDTYLFEAGDGHDAIVDTEGLTRIDVRYGTGLGSENFALKTDGFDLIITSNREITDDSETVETIFYRDFFIHRPDVRIFNENESLGFISTAQILDLFDIPLPFENIEVDTSVSGEVVFNNYLVTDFSVSYEDRFFGEDRIVFDVFAEFGSDSFASFLSTDGSTQYRFADGLVLPEPTILQLDGESVFDPETGQDSFRLDLQSSTEAVWVVAAPEYFEVVSFISGINEINTGSGDDVIYTRALDSVINGGLGNDTYIYNGLFFGSVVITGETTESGNDDSVFLQNFDLTTVAFRHDADQDTLNIFRIESSGLDDPGGLVIQNPETIENFIFDDGTRIENLILGDNFAIDHPVKDGLKYLYTSHASEWIVTGDGLRDLYAGGGDDVVYGNRNRNNINGGDGDDIMFGGFSNDMLSGHNGDDILYGQEGDDVFLGGQGADKFVFDYSDTFDRNNRLRDFSPEEGDIISFENIFGDFDPLREAIGDFIELGTRGGKSAINIDQTGSGENFQPIILFETQTGGALQVDFTIEQLFASGNLEIV